MGKRPFKALLDVGLQRTTTGARIFGNHITDYMKSLQKEDGEKFKRQFSNWTKCHAAAIANPDRVKAKGNAKPVRKVIVKGKALVQQNSKGQKWLRHFRITTAQRKANAANKLLAAVQAMAGK